ncbi:MAG TPA: YihY/virulence factor BrkB family protein [Chitinophagales bacterium]|nr:YihY/virulence factor BrkB family protein [Chitinophagales bacterium]
MKITRLFSFIYQLLKQTFTEFLEDNAIKFSAALAYYTIFAMAPALLIIMSLLGFFFGKDAIEGEVYGQINSLVGAQAALQIQDIIKNIHLTQDNLFATAIGAGLLLIAASGIFGEIQDSINSIWGIKAKPKRGIVKLLINRLLSFSMLVTIGFILTVTLMINALVNLLSTAIGSYFPGMTLYFLFAFDNLLTIVAITSLFAIIFKILPDAQIKWKFVMVGALVTAALFMIGKFVIGYYLAKSNIASVYGAAASIMIIMVWVYYNAIILYFGAEFTQVYTQLTGGLIHPKKYAVLIEKNIVEIK